MRAADYDDRLWRTWPGADRNSSALVAQCHALGAAAGDAAPRQVRGRCRDNAEDRLAELDQRDIDGEFVAAGDEFSRAVKRIDQEINPALQRLGLPLSL